MSSTDDDRIEKSLVLRAPRSRVWKALTDPAQFGQWFRATVTGGFEPGAQVRAVSTYPGHEGTPIDFTVERVEPESLFALRWRAAAPGPGDDPFGEPQTHVLFTLEEVEGGTRLTVVESGLGKLPPALRAQVFRDNSEGWTLQLDNIARHVT
jgi:uncharacterized protein YndB with AHSA1/START domain